MPIQMNGASIGSVFSGGTPISEVYMGGTLVWQNVPKVTLMGLSDVGKIRAANGFPRTDGKYWSADDKLLSGYPNWNEYPLSEVPFRITLNPTAPNWPCLFGSWPGDYPAKNALEVAPDLDLSHVADMTAFFQWAVNLKSVPEYRIPSCTSIKDFLIGCSSLPSLVLRDCGKVSNVRNLFGGGSDPDLRALTRVELHGLGPALPAGHVLDLTKTGLTVDGAAALFDSLGTSTQPNRPVIALPESAWAVDQRPAIRKGWRVRTYPEITFSTVEQFGNAVRVTGWPQLYTSGGVPLLFWAGDTRSTLPYTLNAQGMTNAYGMFNARQKSGDSNTTLKTIPWFDTRNVTTMQGMFNGCAALTEVPELDTRNVTTMQSMFQGCSALTSVPELDLTSCTNVRYMFGSAETNPVLPTVTLHNMQRVENCEWMFGDESDNPAPKLKSARLNGLGPGLTNNMKLDMRRTGLTKDGANTLMDSLGTVTSGRTVTLQLPSGANGCDTSKATSKRWKVTIG